jgi:hypothetical protein
VDPNNHFASKGNGPEIVAIAAMVCIAIVSTALGLAALWSIEPTTVPEPTPIVVQPTTPQVQPTPDPHGWDQTPPAPAPQKKSFNFSPYQEILALAKESANAMDNDSRDQLAKVLLTASEKMARFDIVYVDTVSEYISSNRPQNEETTAYLRVFEGWAKSQPPMSWEQTLTMLKAASIIVSRPVE